MSAHCPRDSDCIITRLRRWSLSLFLFLRVSWQALESELVRLSQRCAGLEHAVSSASASSRGNAHVTRQSESPSQRQTPTRQLEAAAVPLAGPGACSHPSTRDANGIVEQHGVRALAHQSPSHGPSQGNVAASLAGPGTGTRARSLSPGPSPSLQVGRPSLSLTGSRSPGSQSPPRSHVSPTWSPSQLEPEPEPERLPRQRSDPQQDVFESELSRGDSDGRGGRSRPSLRDVTAASLRDGAESPGPSLTGSLSPAPGPSHGSAGRAGGGQAHGSLQVASGYGGGLKPGAVSVTRGSEESGLWSGNATVRSEESGIRSENATLRERSQGTPDAASEPARHGSVFPIELRPQLGTARPVLT